MAMELTDLRITRDDFEHHVPVAQSKNDSIFESCASFIESEGADFCEFVLGDVGMEALDNDSLLRSSSVAAVCNRGFALAIRQLDVVLTATGFGVVSTQDLTPASQARIQAVEESVRMNILRSTRRAVLSLRSVSGWADTEAAQICIPHVCWNYREMLPRAGMENIYSLWVNSQPAINDAVSDITDNISPEMMSVLLDEERRGTRLTIYHKQLKNNILHTAACRMAGDGPKYDAAMLRMMQLLEDNIDNFPEYRGSSTYEAKHYKGYENRQDSKVFFF